MRIYRCKSCTKIHVEAGNIFLHFSSIEKLKTWLDYLNSIDTAYYASLNRAKGLSKEIILAVGENISVNMAFTVQEFEELKQTITNYLSNQSVAFQVFMPSVICN